MVRRATGRGRWGWLIGCVALSVGAACGGDDGPPGTIVADRASTPTAPVADPTPAASARLAAVATDAGTGVADGTRLTSWRGSLDVSAADLPVEQHEGRTCQVIEAMAFRLRDDQRLYVDTPCVLIRSSSFTTTGNVASMISQAPENEYLAIDRSSFDGGPFHVRGVQADHADLVVTRSNFVRFGDAAIEMNDRRGTATLLVDGCYLYEPKGWQIDAHVDGVQMSAGGGITVRNSTILLETFGGEDGDYDNVSNSAIGIGSTLGDVGDVHIEGNLLAGGGYDIYVQTKDFAFTGSVTITGNVFDRRFGDRSGIWGPLFPDGVPAQTAWTDNIFDDGTPIDLDGAIALGRT